MIPGLQGVEGSGFGMWTILYPFMILTHLVGKEEGLGALITLYLPGGREKHCNLVWRERVWNPLPGK